MLPLLSVPRTSALRHDGATRHVARILVCARAARAARAAGVAAAVVALLTLPLRSAASQATAPGSNAPAATVAVPTLTFDGARRIAAAAAEHAQRNGWGVSIAVVDAHGELLFFAKLDGAHQQSVNIAQAKARTAARWRRETKALEDAVAAGRTVLMAVEGMLPLEGGVPIILDGRVIGAVGVSGVTSAQDAQTASAGIRAVFPAP